MNDLFRLAFLSVDTVPDMRVFDSSGASVHEPLAEAVREAMRGPNRELRPFIFSRGVLFHPHNIEALAAALDEHSNGGSAASRQLSRSRMD